jgi:hypothetical protein
MLLRLITSPTQLLRLDSQVHQYLEFSSHRQEYKHKMRSQLTKLSRTIDEVI